MSQRAGEGRADPLFIQVTGSQGDGGGGVRVGVCFAGLVSQGWMQDVGQRATSGRERERESCNFADMFSDKLLFFISGTEISLGDKLSPALSHLRWQLDDTGDVSASPADLQR